jgi:hypothetical protein
MAQLAEENTYSLERWNFREEVLYFLENLKASLAPLEKDFVMLTGDCCCTTCASYEVGSAMNESNKIYGLFWHIQDEEGMSEGKSGLYIGFLGNSEAGSLRAGNTIVRRLKEENYNVVWNGSVEHRIFVSPRIAEELVN